jgi:hypothetical protein
VRRRSLKTSDRANPQPREKKARMGPHGTMAPDKCFVRNTLLISALNRILCVESRKVLISKDLRLLVNRVL